MARKKQRDEGSGYNFMDTYGDMMTLLFTFFVLMFSMSSVEQEKWEMLVRAFTSRGNETTQIVLTPEGTGSDIGTNNGHTSSNSNETIDLDTALPETFDELYEYLKAYTEQNNMTGSVQVEKTGSNTVFVRFSDNIFFYPDSDKMRPEALPLIDFLGKALVNVEDKIRLIKISGHTADPKIENYGVSDRVLSTDRANRVLIYLEDEYKFDPKKLTASGYGKHYPIADNSTPEGRSKNRRVEMLIIGNEIDVTSQEELYLIIEDALKKPLIDGTANGDIKPQPQPQPNDTADKEFDKNRNDINISEGLDETA